MCVLVCVLVLFFVVFFVLLFVWFCWGGRGEVCGGVFLFAFLFVVIHGNRRKFPQLLVQRQKCMPTQLKVCETA